MNKRTFSTLLVASTLSFNALADDVVPTFKHETVGASKTRAEVMAELRQAQADGSYALLHSDSPIAPGNVLQRQSRHDTSSQVAGQPVQGDAH